MVWYECLVCVSLPKQIKVLTLKYNQLLSEVRELRGCFCAGLNMAFYLFSLLDYFFSNSLSVLKISMNHSGINTRAGPDLTQHFSMETLQTWQFSTLL